jgi:hypothetical protein
MSLITEEGANGVKRNLEDELNNLSDEEVDVDVDVDVEEVGPSNNHRPDIETVYTTVRRVVVSRLHTQLTLTSTIDKNTFSASATPNDHNPIYPTRV